MAWSFVTLISSSLSLKWYFSNQWVKWPLLNVSCMWHIFLTSELNTSWVKYKHNYTSLENKLCMAHLCWAFDQLNRLFSKKLIYYCLFKITPCQVLYGNFFQCEWYDLLFYFLKANYKPLKYIFFYKGATLVTRSSLRSSSMHTNIQF